MRTRIALTADGVSLLLKADDDRLPEVIHWGAPVGSLDEEVFDALALGATYQVAPNQPDVPPRYTLLLEGRYGWFGKPGLVSHREGREWTPEWRVTGILVDGTEAAGFVEAGPSTVEIRALSDTGDLELTLTLVLNDQGLISTRGHLRNAGDGVVTVDEFTLGLPTDNRASEGLDFAGRWGVERFAQRRGLAVGQLRREGRHGRTGADSAYVLHVGTPGFNFEQGEIWAVHTAWSGNHIHLAERDAIGFQALSGGELLLAGEMRLAPGTAYETPWVFFNYGVGLDAIAGRFHRYLRSLPHAPSATRPVTLNVWEAVYFDHDTDRLLDLAERAAALGVERFVLDDGWFGSRRDDHSGLGDWVVSDEAWPEGLHPLVDRVHQLGMQFGLWFEPEMVNLDSDVARAHPDWVMQQPGRLPIESRFQHVLNLSIPEAFDHVLGQMDAVLSLYRIDHVKWDANRDLIDAGTVPGGEAAVHAQTLAFYRLLDALRARHPHIEWESCASGGARIDLEVLSRAERVWVSDVIDPEERQRMLTWTSQLIPPEFQGSHIASGRSHTTARWHDLNFRAATAVFGHLGIEWDLAQASEEELAQLSWWIDWYKANRHVLMGGRQVRIDLRDPQTYFKGMITDQKAIFSLSVLTWPATASLGRLRFIGLDPDARYRVHVIDRQLVYEVHHVPWIAAGEDLIVTGQSLMSAGLLAPHMHPATAVIFEFERI